MPKVVYKKVKRQPNPIAKALKHDGVLRPKVIGDKRSKQLENQARKRELEFLRMNRKDYENE